MIGFCRGALEILHSKIICCMKIQKNYYCYYYHNYFILLLFIIVSIVTIINICSIVIIIIIIISIIIIIIVVVNTNMSIFCIIDVRKTTGTTIFSVVTNFLSRHSHTTPLKQTIFKLLHQNNKNNLWPLPIWLWMNESVICNTCFLRTDGN